ncbi:GerAB/ArcD/ProY family transporter [Paenibacillus radicis (ex Xue et al. 2023)]|uniref:Endospore germination permease n=1 Tax=Paenibacillus radicis (ex Xue et al. 2023) TaxID=2972489 RepID=A0ABT1YPD7_9BACL|nr:endospore germination permease [Paenibacillus radicis (ex Xue et al. 2023)]MCR8635042.1 endospore germination permease [Paenibacillus radicis (ex Xue et al. 2023)]
MLEKGKISAFQMGLLMYPVILATGFLSLPAITAHYTQNDIWLTPLIASATGFVSIYTATRLHELFPKQTIIQYSGQLIGKIPGKIVSMIYFLFLTHTAGTITRQYADFVTGTFLFRTPLLLVILSILLLAAFAVRGGIELVARSAVILVPIFILPIFILLLLFPDLDAKNIFPILSGGLLPVIKGAAAPQAWFSEYFLISFFLPNLTDPKKGRKWGIISLSAVVLSLTYINLIILFLLGPDIANKIYPLLVAFRSIGVASFLENLESLLLVMWVVGNFIKLSGFFYMAALAFGQCFELSDCRPIIFPLGLLIAITSLWDLPSLPVMEELIRYVAPFELPTMLTLIPLLLLILAVLRKRKATAGGDSTP